MKINEVLVAPVLTEKATEMANRHIYTFHVHKNANKFQVKEAVEKLYSVKVSVVRIKNKSGKQKKVGKKMLLKKLPDKKFAIIEVGEGKIGLFPQT